MSKITAATAIDTISRYMLADILPLVVDLERSRGNRLYDLKSQRELLDCFSFIASNPIGHNHPKMNEPAFEKKLLRVAKTKPSNSDLYSVELAEFVDTIARVAMPAELQHLFCVEGGTLAVENALKTAFDWKVRLNDRRGIKGEKGSQVIHFRESFHGRSGYCLSLTNTADPRKYKYFPKFNWPRISPPKMTFPCEGETLRAVIEAEEQALAEIALAFQANPDDVAAILIEPIQSEGGDNHFRPEFHQALRRLADEHEAMLIYDEVQTGVGLTGKMWAYEHYGVVPDIVCFGKKMQVCGIFVGPRVDEVENNVFQEKSRINSTWGGALVDMVRAQRYLEIIEEDNLVQNAAKVGALLLQGLEELQGKFSDVLSNVRGKGLLSAVDLPSTELRDQLKQKVIENGAVVIGCGQRSIRFRPSLTFSEAEVGELLDILQRSLHAVV